MKKPICKKCLKNKGTIPYCKWTRKDGTIKKNYHCTTCNSKRIKAYYHTKKGNEIIRRLNKISYRKFKHKFKARQKLNYLISKGVIKRPSKCQVCKLHKKRIQGHHEDYTKPLEVIWCCPQCHWKIDHI